MSGAELRSAKLKLDMCMKQTKRVDPGNTHVRCIKAKEGSGRSRAFKKAIKTAQPAYLYQSPYFSFYVLRLVALISSVISSTLSGSSPSSDEQLDSDVEDSLSDILDAMVDDSVGTRNVNMFDARQLVLECQYI